MPYNIKVDNSRPGKEVEEAEDKLNKMKEFYQMRLMKLQSRFQNLDNFLKAVGCEDLCIGNMYAAGSASVGDAYNEDSRMIAHCTITSKKDRKNVNLFLRLLKGKWMEMVPGLSAEFVEYKIKGNEVKFQIWI